MGQQRFPCAAAIRIATSSDDHQLVIKSRDDMLSKAILTIVAQRAAAICEETF